VGAEAAATFSTLQPMLTFAPMLQLPDFNKAFIDECDASAVGMGAMLHQGHELLLFFSKQLTTHHASLVVYEHELIGLVLTVRHWRPYLWGRSFLI
jgi:hypothetical protein